MGQLSGGRAIVPPCPCRCWLRARRHDVQVERRGDCRRRAAEACFGDAARAQALAHLLRALLRQRRRDYRIGGCGDQRHPCERRAMQANGYLVEHGGKGRLDGAAADIEAELARDLDVDGAVGALVDAHGCALEPRLEPLPLGHQRLDRSRSLLKRRRTGRRARSRSRRAAARRRAPERRRRAGAAPFQPEAGLLRRASAMHSSSTA